MLHFFPCCSLFMFFYFHVALSSCCTFFILHSFHVTLFSWCSFPVLHYFHIAIFSYCTVFMLLFLCRTPSMLHFLRVALFSCCTVISIFFRNRFSVEIFGAIASFLDVVWILYFRSSLNHLHLIIFFKHPRWIKNRNCWIEIDDENFSTLFKASLNQQFLKSLWRIIICMFYLAIFGPHCRCIPGLCPILEGLLAR